MKFVQTTVFIFVFTFVQFNCNNAPKGISIQKEFQISFPDSKLEIWSYSNSIYTDRNGDEYISYAASNAKKLYLINISNNKIEHTIQLSKVDSMFDFRYNKLRFFIHNLDSIFILPDESKTILLIGRNGQILNDWDIKINTDKYNFVLSGFYTSPFAYYHGKIYVRFIPKIDPFKQKGDYFNLPPEIAIDIKNENKISRIGGWPEKYRKENYYDDYPFRYIKADNNKVEFIYSYSAEEKIYVYEDNKLVNKYSAKSDYINNFIPFSDDSIGNIAYTMKYLITSPKYGKIIYDKYRDLYYRFAFQQTEYVNPDGKTIKRNLDQPWSLIILNGKYEKINEIKFDPTKYACSPIYVSKEGLVIPKRNEDVPDKYQWNFVLFKVNE